MKYLIEVHHGFGDVVQTTGLIETLYEFDKNADIGLILNTPNRAVFFKNDYRINNIYYINVHEGSKYEIIKTLYTIRKKKYDFAFFSPISNRRDTQILAVLLGAKQNYGEQFKDLCKISNRYHYVKKENVNFVERNNNLLLASGLVKEVSAPKLIGLKLKNEYENELQTDKLIGICIGTGKPAKTWALDNYLAIATKLETEGYHIAFLGGKAEATLLPETVFDEHRNWHNFMNRLDIVESAAIAQRCTVLIGGDTGVMHIAAAVGTTTVAIYSCSDPRLFAPYSERSYVVTTHVDCQFCYTEGGFNTCPEYRCLNVPLEEVDLVLHEVLAGNEIKKYKYGKGCIVKNL